MRVEVYWNLHKKLWSVRALEGPDKGRIIQHMPDVWLSDCKMVVQPAGRARVRREKRKNVHAFVRGTLRPASYYHAVFRTVGDGFSYNPYRDDTFKRVKDGTPIYTAAHVNMVILGGGPEMPYCRAWEEGLS